MNAIGTIHTFRKPVASAATFAAAIAVVLSLSACGKYDYEEFVTIKPNETAFVIQLDGDTKKGQAKFGSEKYLEELQVATKRIQVPHRKKDLGGANNYEFIPTIEVIKVDRTPVTREWTKSKSTGTSASNEAISVESIESIDFAIGVSMTASIPEDKAAMYLYSYAGMPLSQVADTNIRGFVQTVLAREFGSRSLDKSRSEKREIFEIVLKEAKAKFEPKGIVIDNLGFSEGMTYADENIQKSINATFQAKMAVEKAAQKVAEAIQLRLAAEEFAKAKDAQTAKTQLENETIRAQATLVAANKWDGHLPASVVPQGSQLMFGLDKPVK